MTDKVDRQKAEELVRRIAEITDAPEFADILVFGPSLL